MSPVPKLYHYSRSSLRVRETLDSRLQLIFDNVLLYKDHTLSSGHRSREEQNALVAEGLSKLKYPFSKHNAHPKSLAVDVYPYPQKWKEWREWPQRAELYEFAGMVKAIAGQLGYGDILRWGGDWDRDNDFTDQQFDDLGHFELNVPYLEDIPHVFTA